MRKNVRILFWIIVIALILIQFIPVEFPEVKLDNEKDLLVTGKINGEVAEILKTSCYDCHSNESQYPWYSYVAPTKWLVIRDIKEGRKEMNFSLWGNLEKREQIKKLGDIGEEVKDNKMPLPIYTIIHRNARLDQDQREKLINWTEAHIEVIFGE